MDRLSDIGLKLIMFAARPWFWFYENFVNVELDDEEVQYIQGAIEYEEPEGGSYHVIMNGVEHTSFESLKELKKFVKEYEE